MTSERRYWFRAKRHGWGWGLPDAWQGWAVLFGWAAALIAARVFLRPGHVAEYRGFVAFMVLLLALVCFWKGEPARWRWGDSDE